MCVSLVPLVFELAQDAKVLHVSQQAFARTCPVLLVVTLVNDTARVDLISFDFELPDLLPSQNVLMDSSHVFHELIDALKQKTKTSVELVLVCLIKKLVGLILFA